MDEGAIDEPIGREAEGGDDLGGLRERSPRPTPCQAR